MGILNRMFMPGLQAEGENEVRVVQINYDAVPIGGASIAMLRIHRAIRSAGVDSIIVCRKSADDEKSILYRLPLRYRIVEFCFKVFQKVLYGKCDSTGLINTGMADFVNALNPDIVQLNWLQANTIGINELLKIKCPIVWFTHDLWGALGTAVYPLDDCYKKENPGKSILDRMAWRNKRNVVQRLKNRLWIVSPSEWACNEARKSIVFREVPCRCIHYPLSFEFVSASKSIPTEHRRCRNEKFTILFGSTTGISSHVKGWDRLMAAIDLLPHDVREKTRIQVFGCSAEARTQNGVEISFKGKLKNEDLIPLYRGADVFAFPSRKETWGQTKVEALCCGLPVIAFDQTACANGIRHRENGWVAHADDISMFTEGILWFFQKWVSDDPLVIRNEDMRYLPEAIAKDWIRLYAEILRG